MTTLPATLAESDDEGVWGPATPPPAGPGEFLGAPEDPPPWEELSDVVGRLWDEGQETLVYMLVYDLETRLQETQEDEVLATAFMTIRAYGDGITRLLPAQGWTDWMSDLLRRWRIALWWQRRDRPRRQVEEVDFMQRSMAMGPRRPAVWLRYMEQLSEYLEGVRAVVYRGLEAWLRRQVEAGGPRMCVLGGMLRDVTNDRVIRKTGNDKERELGRQMVAVLTEELDRALLNGDLVEEVEAARSRLGAAVRDMSMDLANRSDRFRDEDAIPLEDGWGNSLEGEEVEVGMAVTRWLRERLPAASAQRTELYRQVVQGLRVQLTQECRHLRRLHMALEHVYVMGVDTGEALSQGEPEDSQLPPDAKDLTVGQGSSRPRPTVLDMLRGPESTSSSAMAAAAEGRDNGGERLFFECESLRKWLNHVFEASLSTLTMEMMQTEDQGSVARMVTDSVLPDEDSTLPDPLTPDEGDEEALVQKPPWESKGKGKGEREDSRERRESTRRHPRSRSRERRTWSSASASGWDRSRGRMSAADGNEHRPWRRERARLGVASSVAGEAVPDETVTNITTGLLGPQAWHCLLDMRSPLEPSSTWGYGLAPSSRANIESSFATMSPRERQFMSMELLRVVSAVLADIAQAVTNALDQAGDEGAELEGEEGDGHNLMQALPAAKADKLREASRPREIGSLLGSQFDKLTRSLMASLERMATDEARRVGQALANRLVNMYGVQQPTHLPPDAECLLSGFVTFGAEFQGNHEPLVAMDSYFVEHWWSLVEATLPPPLAMAPAEEGMPAEEGTSVPSAANLEPGNMVGKGMSHSVMTGVEHVSEGSLSGLQLTTETVTATTASGALLGTGTMATASGGQANTGSSAIGSVQVTSTSGLPGMAMRAAGGTADGPRESVVRPTTPATQIIHAPATEKESGGHEAGDVEEHDEGGRQRQGKRKDWSLALPTSSRIDLEDPQFQDAEARGSLPGEWTAGGTEGSSMHHPTSRMRRAMEDESNRLAAAHYREWERLVMAEAMGCLPEPPGIRRVGGWQAPTQSMSFRLQAGETLDLRIAFPELAQGQGQLPAGDVTEGEARLPQEEDDHEA